MCLWWNKEIAWCQTNKLICCIKLFSKFKNNAGAYLESSIVYCGMSWSSKQLLSWRVARKWQLKGSKNTCKRNIALKTDILDVFQSGAWCRRWMEAREDWLVVSPWICWRSVRRDQASVGRDRETKGKQKRESLQSVQAELRAEQQSLRKGMWVSKEGWIYHR